MKSRLCLSFLAVSMMSLQGCHLVLGKVLGAGQYKEALRAAPAVPNPAKTGTATDTLVVGNDGVQYKMSSYSAEEMCFEARLAEDPSTVQRYSFELLALKSPEEDRDKAPKQRSSSTRVLSSTSELRPVTRTATDTIKDGSGRVIATQERQVQELERAYTTDARVCFARPTIVTPEARFLVLVPSYSSERVWATGLDVYAVWRLD